MKRKRANRETITSVAMNDRNEALVSRGGEIRFVLPRTLPKGKSGNLNLVQFLFPGQQQPRSDDASLPQQKRSKTDESRSPGQSVDAVLKKKSGSTGGAGAKDVGDVGQEHIMDETGSKSLVRSVQDAVNDKVGRRPRANSTDHELNLPQHGLCDERIVLQSHKWDVERLYKRNGASSQVKVPPPRGFTNLGNTCFLNATLQCLAYLPSFCHTITALPDHCYELNKEGAQIIHGQRITMYLRRLLRLALGITAVEKNEPPKTTAITPKGIHKAITSCKINGYRFRPGRQEDAHELLVHLLDAMHEGELFAAGINPHKSGWRDKLPILRLDETTFVHRIFGGYYRSQLKCNKCGYKSNTYDPFLDLALEVSKKHINSLSAAFMEFTRKEKLDSKNSWKCSGCKKHVCPTKQLSVFRPPLSLCIHLKRFGFDAGGSSNHGGWGFGHRHLKGLSVMGNRGAKISKKIDFPAQLSLPLSDGRECQYMLTGVIIHVGNCATSGHYTSYVKQPGDPKQWCHMDDSYAEAVSEKTVLKQRDAYVLFYTRREVKLEFPQPPPREQPLFKEVTDNTSPAPSPNCDLSALKHAKSALKQANEANSSSPEPVRRGNLAGVKQSLSYTTKNGRHQPKQRKSWNPHRDKGDDSSNGNSLLNNVAVGNWNDHESGPKTTGGSMRGKSSLLRSAALDEMESKARSKKRKMNISYWDSMLDGAKQKKRKKS